MLAAFNRPRRNRSSQFIRDLLQETRLSTDDLVYPLFLTDSKNISQAIPALPNIFRLSVDLLCKEIEQCLQLGIKAFVIFPVVEKSYKDKYATNSYNTSFFYLKSLKKIKDTFSEALIITDVAMDPYSSDGHDGLLENGIILNDATLEILGKMALAQAATGIDYVGLSDMMDHRVAYIRDLLENNGFTETGIISYTTKYASSFYGPFREALDSNPKTGDKKKPTK